MNVFALISLLSCAISIFIGFYVLHRKPGDKVNQFFFLFSVSAAYWAFMEFMYRQADTFDSAYFWLKASGLWAFAIALLLHFALQFTGKSKFLKSKLTLVLIYLPALAFSILDLTTNQMTGELIKVYWGWTYSILEYSLINDLSNVWSVSVVFLALYLCLRYYMKATERRKRKQVGYLILGIIVPMTTGGITEVILPYLGYRFPESSTSGFAIGCLIIGYSIWKYELFTLTPAAAAESIISAMTDALILVNPDGKIVRINQATLKLLGYEESELVNQQIETIFAPAEGEEIWNVQLRKTDLVGEIEVSLKTIDGRSIPTSISESVLRDKEGIVQGRVYICRDITERKRTEVALRASEERYRDLFENSPIALFEQDFSAVKQRLEALHNQGVTDFWAFFEEHPEVVTECIASIKVTDMNKAALKLYGASSKAELLAGLDRFVPADAYGLFQKELIWITEGRAEYEWEGVNQTLAGERIDIHLHLSAVPGYEDTMAKVLVSIDDITGRKKTEDALKKQAKVLESMAESVYVTDEAGIMIFRNSAFEAMFGYAPYELPGKHALMLYNYSYEESLRRFVEIIVQLKRKGTWFGEINNRKKDGTPFTTYARISAMELFGKKYWIFVQEDITERKRVEEAEREQRALAEALCDTAAALSSTLHLDEVLDRILANVSLVAPCDSANVMLVESGIARIAYHRGYAERGLEEFARSLCFTLDDMATLHHMVETGKPLIIPDTQTYPQWVNIPETRWIRSYAGVPILINGETVGFINLNCATPGFFTPAHGERLQAFTAQAAVAIENARLYEDVRDSCDTQLKMLEELDQTTLQLRQRAEQMVTLMETNRAITEDIGFKETLERILIYARRIVPVSDCSMTLVDESSGDLVVQVSTDGEAGLRINPADPSAVGWVIATKQILVEENVSANPIFNQQLVQRYGMKSGLVVPIIYKDRAIGALAFGETQGRRAFTDAEKMMAQAFAYQVAIAIENARLYEDVRAGRERLQTLSSQLVEAQEVERRHIARELHDEIGQALTGLKLALEISALSTAETVKIRLDEAKTLIGELLARVREMSLDLRPGMLDDLGLLPALLWHFERFTAQTGVQVDFKYTGLEGQRFLPGVETAAYRIVQEALTNVARHAGVGLAAVCLRASQDRLGVQIEDQGIGFDSEATLASGGSSGLTGMCERAALLGGQLTIESAPGAGTRVKAELPLAERLERRTIEKRI